ncbi:MAG: thiamine biosynthesis protein [Deltaproteobacteria bacterium]|nr:thiamine biosynthesis protein [Deltaproteobacteria bacterium]
MKEIKALSLFSGGLDSILATRLVMDQGIEVVAVQFVTPFFNYHILEDIEGHKARIRSRFGINVEVFDISDGYLQLLRNPAHGFGKNFNPCIDCKIYMLSRAKEMMADLGAKFLITGEVLGQRPMSQRRDTLNVIERDSGSRSILLRPLSAKLMVETEAEKEGWVDRAQLLDFSGRGRSKQIRLAAEYGITDFPAPAGGCTLADPILSRRVSQLYSEDSVLQPAQITTTDVRLLLVGRQFILPGGGWLILGRDERDNDKLEVLAGPDDALLWMEERPGPAALLRRAASWYEDSSSMEKELDLVASLVVRYGKKIDSIRPPGEVTCRLQGNSWIITAEPLEDTIFQDWMR